MDVIKSIEVNVKIDDALVNKAIKALLDYNSKKESNDKISLVGSSSKPIIAQVRNI